MNRTGGTDITVFTVGYGHTIASCLVVAEPLPGIWGMAFRFVSPTFKMTPLGAAAWYISLFSGLLDSYKKTIECNIQSGIHTRVELGVYKQHGGR